MKAKDKARAVLVQVARPGNYVEFFDQEEIERLAVVYDETLAPREEMAAKFDAVWVDHKARLEESKADVDEGADTAVINAAADEEPATTPGD